MAGVLLIQKLGMHLYMLCLPGQRHVPHLF